MTDSEKLGLILNEINFLKDEFEVLKIKSELTHRKLDDLTLDVKVAECSIKEDIAKLEDEMETVVTVLQGKDLLPKAQ